MERELELSEESRNALNSAGLPIMRRYTGKRFRLPTLDGFVDAVVQELQVDGGRVIIRTTTGRTFIHSGAATWGEAR